MGQKLVMCCKCKKVFSFNTRYLHQLEPAEAGKHEKRVFTVACLHCGANNKVEVEI